MRALVANRLGGGPLGLTGNAIRSEKIMKHEMFFGFRPIEN